MVKELIIKNKIVYRELLKAIQVGDYALRPHTINHMLDEGFKEGDIIEAIRNGKILELYDEENRCLITGTFKLSENVKEHLHVVIDY